MSWWKLSKFQLQPLLTTLKIQTFVLSFIKSFLFGRGYVSFYKYKTLGSFLCSVLLKKNYIYGKNNKKLHILWSVRAPKIHTSRFCWWHPPPYNVSSVLHLWSLKTLHLKLMDTVFANIFSISCGLQERVREQDLKQLTQRLSVSQEQCSIWNMRNLEIWPGQNNKQKKTKKQLNKLIQVEVPQRLAFCNWISYLIS